MSSFPLMLQTEALRLPVFEVVQAILKEKSEGLFGKCGFENGSSNDYNKKKTEVL